MSHFAKVLDGRVIQVMVAEPEFFLPRDQGGSGFVDSSPGDWIQASYNTRGNVHYLPNSHTPSGQPAVRGNYPSVGYVYDYANDVFYPPQPGPEYTLDTATWTWVNPNPLPALPTE
jgi:hypothetical protein